MKNIYTKDLYKGQTFTDETFAIFEIKLADDKNGNQYANITLGDKTGRLGGKIWSEQLAKGNKSLLKEGKLINISAKVDEYKGNLQLTVMSFEQVDETQLDEFVSKSEFEADDMIKELYQYLDNFINKDLANVIKLILESDQVKDKFKYWPAAQLVHHDFRSGLIQHVLEMLSIAKGIERFYPNLDFDVLNAGIILHDIGKIYELDGSSLSIPYTTEGQLVGHIYMGTKLFEDYAEGKIDPKIKLHVMHLILSHHGKYEYGAPVLPSTVEAQMLHYIDNVSAKARTADTIKKSIPDSDEFSTRAYFLENTKIWKGYNVSNDDRSDTDDGDDIDQLTLV